MRTITIVEDVKIPGTNVILEKGDRVQVITESKDLQRVWDYIIKGNDPYRAGRAFGSALVNAIIENYNESDYADFAEGLNDSISATTYADFS